MKSVKVVASAAVLGAASVLSLQASAVSTTDLNTLGTFVAGQSMGASAGVLCTQLMAQSSMFNKNQLNCR